MLRFLIDAITSTVLSRSKAPPAPHPTLRGDEAEAIYTTNCITGKVHNVQSFMPGKSSSVLDALILGDSYADDVDMWFETWPSRLARSRGGNAINCAVGGSLAHHTLSQLATAKRLAARRGVRLTRETLVVVHVGGNDLLHALFTPWMAPLLIFDVLRLARRHASPWRRALAPPLGADLGPLSFFGRVAAQVGAQLRALVDAVAAEGAEQLLLSSLPICTALPLARLLVRGLTLGLGSEELVRRRPLL
jgi:hypothetical protein